MEYKLFRFSRSLVLKTFSSRSFSPGCPSNHLSIPSSSAGSPSAGLVEPLVNRFNERECRGLFTFYNCISLPRGPYIVCRRMNDERLLCIYFPYHAMTSFDSGKMSFPTEEGLNLDTLIESADSGCGGGGWGRHVKGQVKWFDGWTRSYKYNIVAGVQTLTIYRHIFDRSHRHQRHQRSSPLSRSSFGRSKEYKI